jgi:crotonobetaine/carnitine-CoA ligase
MQAEQRPEKRWLVFDDVDHLTFAEARDLAHRFAEALRVSGFAPSTVAIMLRNQREFVPAFLGAQAAGGVPAPLNPELRGPLLETLLARCAADVLVARADLLPILAEAPGLVGVRLVVVCGRPRAIPPCTGSRWSRSTPGAQGRLPWRRPPCPGPRTWMH